MHSTRGSLIDRAGGGSEDAWFELVQLYVPMVTGWLRRQSVSVHDAEEIGQDVMAFVVQNLSTFDHSGRTGAFRRWLREITLNRLRAFWRKKSGKANALGGSIFQHIADQLEDPSSDLSLAWDSEHDAYVLRAMLTKMEQVFQPETFEVFRRLSFDGASPSDLATEFGLSIGAVYGAKSRVLRKLREEAAGLLELDRPE